jgi:hypothetical protein
MKTFSTQSSAFGKPTARPIDGLLWLIAECWMLSAALILQSAEKAGKRKAGRG